MGPAGSPPPVVLPGSAVLLPNFGAMDRSRAESDHKAAMKELFIDQEERIFLSRFSQTEACAYGLLASNLYIGQCVPGFPSYALKIPHAIFVIGPQRNSKLRIPEIYDRTECCCSPRQAQNSQSPWHSLICHPFCLMRKCCCGPRQDQHFEVWHGTTNIVIIKIIKTRQ